MNFFRSNPPVVEAPPVLKELHPFYPVGVEIANYVANSMNVMQLLAAFGSGCAVILGSALLISRTVAPKLKLTDRLAVLWFVLSGTIHLFFEGYFAYNHARMGPAQDLFGQLWKEYALSDSRYLTSDPFVLCMETITAAAWGPLCWVLVYYINCSHPLRYPLQAIISLGQIYGDILYYTTCLFDYYYKSLEYCRPEGYYFWFYFFFMNFIWIVIPSLMLFDSVRTTGRAFQALDRMSHALQGNGAVPKPKANGHIKKA